jgi:2-polyprenyl-3-methyl-5-hydroxy-6-metoxy-1,4-benzoquinol methylase
MKRVLECPYCNSKDFSPVIEGAGGKVVECNLCKLRFVSEIAANQEIKYNRSYFEKNSDDQKTGYSSYGTAPTITYLWQLGLVNLFAKRGRLLDIGCATGKFLELLPPDYAAEGIDISEYAVNVAKNKGLNVSVETITGLSQSDKFDAITAWDVVEHMGDLKEGLSNILLRIKPNGYFFLSTPQAEGKAKDWIGYNYSLEHLNFWTNGFVTFLKEEQKDFDFETIELLQGNTLVLIGKRGRFTPGEKKLIKVINSGKFTSKSELDKQLLNIYMSKGKKLTYEKKSVLESDPGVDLLIQISNQDIDNFKKIYSQLKEISSANSFVWSITTDYLFEKQKENERKIQVQSEKIVKLENENSELRKSSNRVYENIFWPLARLILLLGRPRKIVDNLKSLIGRK